MSFTGFLQLSVSKKYGRSIISSCYYEGAFKVTRPVYLEEEVPSIYLIHIGGGYVDGDNYVTELIVEEGAELALTTQSSTKVYKTPKNPVVQQTTIKVGKNSVLEYLPDPLIAYEGARFLQETIVQIEDGACFFYSDIITPGWAEDGGLFRYDWIRSKLKVYKEEKIVVFDHLMLEPDHDIGGIMQMEGYTHVGTFLLIHEQADKKFLQSLYETMEEFQLGVRFGLSALPVNGVILRVLAYNTGVIEKLIAHVHAFARRELLKRENVIWRKY